ncbi:MarR family transcriptional regulator [Afipia sp. Root123D2]|uniref:winged helix-turn-helix transcriptional regulator n=1 Tax=Afipia sp. Root123D2 TaxID=1736436 RepID=UPI000700CA1C|nr:winged helix-turn-helix transcriptional regulator [Afipia sp. Root123D2]KQW22290.1 MarR family transcriptional regulator [Afipia sp. Root123D2]
MERVLPGQSGEDDRIVLGLLNSVEDGATSQRRIAAELGIALGLVNAYLKRCVTKGLIKVSEAPARRYAYYLTPKGFTEKSRLTVEYLSSSFSFFRQAKSDCADVFRIAQARNFHNIVLVGKSDLAEIGILSAADSGVSIVAVLDDGADGSEIIGKEIVSSYDELTTAFDAVVITDLRRARQFFDDAVTRFGAQRVLAPRLLGLNVSGVEASKS